MSSIIYYVHVFFYEPGKQKNEKKQKEKKTKQKKNTDHMQGNVNEGMTIFMN